MADGDANAELKQALRTALQPAMTELARLAERAADREAEALAEQVREHAPELGHGGLRAVLSAYVTRLLRGIGIARRGSVSAAARRPRRAPPRPAGPALPGQRTAGRNNTG